jgi:tetratricopeptide (TPR) repeat protein
MLEERQYENHKQVPLAQLIILRREEARLGEIVKQIENLVDRYPAVSFWRATLGWAYAELGRETEAKRELDRLAAREFGNIPRDMFWLASMTAISETVAMLGEVAGARHVYRLLSPFGGRYVVAFSVCFGSVLRSLGCLAGTLALYDDATQHFEDALKANARLNSPPWVAHTEYGYARMLVARAGTDDRDRAFGLLDKAEKTARELGMKSLMEKTEALRLSAGGAIPTAISGRRPTPASASGLFRREGEYWTLAYEGTVVRMKDSKGLRYIAELLREPGREFYASDLLGSTTEGRGTLQADLGPVVDAASRAAYVRRLEELRDELAEAEANNDIGRAEKARTEVDFLAGTLSGAVGLGGRQRRSGSVSERARLTVTKAVKAALGKIQREHPAMGRLLANTIRTGTFCSYEPDPGAPIAWTF